ncbi:Aquaporin NIP1-1 [Vitis vinifera]|uniref:Aquaporin NIP1-1 n=1 Tax=Vitis vinifera TaxID=29760 RepID=A0A438C988_VITVI|nr:Aquaporin NIP1-1 [Vitis vinifera]
MAEVNILPVGCSPKPPTMSDLSPVEEKSCGCVLIDKKYRLTVMGIAVGWGMIVMVMIYTLGHVSGGHFNPAVTIAFAASRKFPWRQASILSSFFNCCEHRIVASCSVSICCT